MDTSDSKVGSQADDPADAPSEQDFQHLKDDVTEAIGGARQQADAQFGQYRDTAADQIEALAQGAKSFVSQLEDTDTLGMSDYLADMAESMTGLAGSLRGKSAEQLLHDAADLARNNPTLFIAGSVAIGFGLSRFLKAGTSAAATVNANENPASGSSTPPPEGNGAHRPYETSTASLNQPSPGSATGVMPASSNEHNHPTDVTDASAAVSPNPKGEL
ncbi:Uncharacterised protein [Pseudomonas fluorescens]|uniref:Nutrient deprivation-induced protein n=1 Tax=Pseudomonas fluorescens TaxID=294 RepID=A0A3S4R5V8_PSEFL|nr:hypothetical protein [Pseudomonas fluorescens]VEF10836.1 Uncharacterised protein [Pseudomonas fluorescens]